MDDLSKIYNNRSLGGIVNISETMNLDALDGQDTGYLSSVAEEEKEQKGLLEKLQAKNNKTYNHYVQGYGKASINNVS